MALYGAPNSKGQIRRLGTADAVDECIAHFTTANTAAPTVDNKKSQGIIGITRGGVGVFNIQLPWGMRNTDVQVTPFAYPAGATAHTWTAAHVEGSATVTITVRALASGNAADTTGLELGVCIRGRSRS